ncbi:unnamed protein product [Malus baccata var. baccata]
MANKGDEILKLEGGYRNPTNNLLLSLVVIQNDVYAVPNTVKLNRSNYPLWSKVLEMHIARRGRKGFVIGSTKEPAEDNAKLRQEGQPVGVYYADFKSVWQELDQRRPIKMECDIQTKEIIGRGTKREWLYYVDDVVPGRANVVRASRSSNLQEV